MIPFDLATRVRALLDNSIQQVSPAHQVPGNLPRFEAGQRILAQLISPLPDGTFRALIAGRTMTLALPESARSGDALELVVTGQRGETVLARQATPQTGQPPLNPAEASGARPALSQTGQIISQLLTGRFGEPQPLPLARTPSLLPPGAPMPPAGELVQTLRQVVSQSGLFYESHLRQWSEGKLPLSALTQEPQGQQQPLPAAARPATPQQAQTPAPAGSTPQTAASPGATPNSALQQGQAPVASISLGSQASADATSEATRTQQASASQSPAPGQAAARVAEPLMPMVHQQLEVLASQQMSWAGQLWQGAAMHWEITHPDRDGQGNQADDDDPAHAWRSTLRLQLPQMGEVNARLTLGAKGLSLEIAGSDADSVARMRAASDALVQALQAGGVEVLSLQVRDDARA